MKSPIACALLALAPGVAAAQAAPAPTLPVAAPAPSMPAATTLTIDAALARAQAQSPSLRRSRAQADGSAARVDESRAGLRPQLSASASVATGGSAAVQADGTRRNFFSPSHTARVGVGGSWLITDFGQSAARIDAAAASAAVDRAAMDGSTLDVVASVESAYYTAAAQRQLVDVTRAALANQERHLDQATRFVTAGSRAPIEQAQARTAVANARTALVRAENAYATSLENLIDAMGGWDGPAFDVAVSWPAPVADEDAPLAQLVATARGQRPELAGQRMAIQASDASLRATERGLRPDISANAGLDAATAFTDAPTPEWSASISLSWPIFDGGKNRAQLREAAASRAGAQAQLDQLELTVRVDVADAQLSIRAGKAELAAAAEATAAAAEQLHLAEQRYLQGAGNGIELADAQTAVTQTSGDQIGAQLDLATARARLRRALGAAP